jgi:hypothetical protein
LLLCIGFGYPAEAPAAKPRDAAKVKFMDWRLQEGAAEQLLLWYLCDE